MFYTVKGLRFSAPVCVVCVKNKDYFCWLKDRNKEVEADDLFVEVFTKAEEVSKATTGIYDITAAPLINLWGFGFSKSDSVTPAMIDSVRSFIGYQKIRLEGRKVIKDDPRILLNCSSMGDGCSCEVIARLLDSKGIDNQSILSATVIADDCMIADAYATAFMAMGREEAHKIQQQHPELEYLFIYADENGEYCTDYSEGFGQYLTPIIK